MASFADISIRFSANLKQFSSQIQNAERDLKKIGTQFKNVGAGLTLGVTTPLLGLGAAAVNVAADFEVLETSLITAFDGSESAAKNALNSITNFAAKTPFQIEEVADAFIKLKNLGLDPSEEALTSYGNTASAMGKSLNQVIEAVADAATGEFERLKEFGIKAKQQGDQVTFTFKGMETTVKKDSASIQKYLLNIGNTDFAGGMERQSKTFKGQLSTLKDSLSQTGVEFGKIILQYITPFVAKIKDVADAFKNLSPETKKIIVVVGAFAASLGPVLVAVGYLATNVIPGLISAFAALKVAIAANPIGLLVTVVGALAATTLIANSRFRELTDATKEYASITATAAKNIAAEKVELEGLLRKAKDETASKESRLDAVKRLNEIVPEYNRQLTLETINTEKTTAATQKHVQALLNRAKVIAAQEKLVEVERELLELTLGTSDATDPTVYQNLKAAIVGLNNPVAAAIQQGRNLAENFNEEKTQLTALQKKLISFLGDNQSLVDQLNEQTATVTGLNAELGKPIERKVSTVLDPKLEISGVGIDASNEKLREQIAILESARKQYSETSAEYKYLSDQIAFHSTTIANSIKGIVGEGVQLSQFDEAAFNFEQKMNRIKEVAVAVGDTVGGAFESFTGRLVDSLNLADDGFQGFVKGLADTVTKLIAQMLAAALAQSISGATASGTATGPAAVFTTPAFIATAIGGILAAFAAIPKFAEGGLAYGPTLGLMGEYAGARNNPEVIAPLNKLKDLINPAGGGVELSLGSIIRGTDLQIVIERVVDRKLRLG